MLPKIKHIYVWLYILIFLYGEKKQGESKICMYRVYLTLLMSQVLEKLHVTV